VASTQATIDLVVRGSNAVNKLIEDVRQLEGAVKRINSNTLEVASGKFNKEANKIIDNLSKIGTQKDPRQDIAQRVSQLTTQQTSAQNKLARATKAAADAQQKLQERSQRRTKADSQVQRDIEERFQRNQQAAVGYRRELRGIARDFADIQRVSARAAIPQIGELIDVNRARISQKTIKSLADEYVRLGDALQTSSAEKSLSGTFIPRQKREFDALVNQLEGARAKAQALREELARAGKEEKPLRVPAAAPLILGAAQSPMEAIAALKALKEQPTESDVAAQNKEILKRNRRRGAIRSQIQEADAQIQSLETRARDAGQEVVNLQNRLIDLVDPMKEGRSANPKAGLSVSLNQIQAQAESLALVANNSKIASDEFNQYTVAAELASIKLARSQQNTFSALAGALSASSPTPQGLGAVGQAAGARAQVGELIAMSDGLARSEAALGAHIALLSKVKQLVEFTTPEYYALEQAIADLNDELARTNAPSTRLGSLKQYQQQEAFRAKTAQTEKRRRDEIDKILNRQVDVEDKINKAQIDGAAKSRLLERSSLVLTELDQGRLEAAKQLTKETERQLKKASDLAQVKRDETKSAVALAQQKMREEKKAKIDPSKLYGPALPVVRKTRGPVSPITGRLPGGEFIPGSPGAKRQETQSAVALAQQGMREKEKAVADLWKMRGGPALPPGFTEAGVIKQRGEALDIGAGRRMASTLRSGEIIQQSLINLKEKGANVDKELLDLQNLLNKSSQKGLAFRQHDLDILSYEVGMAGKFVQLQKRIIGETASTKRQAAGPSKAIDDLVAQRAYQRDINKAYKDQEDTIEKINKAQLTAEQTNKLTFGIDQAREALLNNQLESSQEITKEINKQLKYEQEIANTRRKEQAKNVNWTSFLARGGELVAENRTKADAAAAEEQIKSRKKLGEQLITLQTLQKRYAFLESSGVKFLDEKVQLGKVIEKISKNEIGYSAQNVDLVKDGIKYFRALAGLRISEARLAGTIQRPAKPKTPEQLEAQRGRLLDIAQRTAVETFNLEQKGVVVADQRLRVEQAIADIQSLRNKASADDLRILAEQVLTIKELNTEQARQLKTGGIPGAGLRASLQQMKQAQAAAGDFLGTLSPAEAIDQIVRQFNSGDVSGGGAGKNVVDTLISEVKSGLGRAKTAGKGLGEAVEDGLNDGLGIASPSWVSKEAMLNVIKTLIDTAKAGKAAVQAAIEDLIAPKLGKIKGAPLLKSITAGVENTLEPIANFVARSSSKPSLYRTLAKLAGPELLSGGAVPQAMQRKAFEAGKIWPETRILTTADRRAIRGSSGVPGGMVEREIARAAVRNVSNTGAFVGPLASSIRAQGEISSRLFSPQSQGASGPGGTGIFSVKPQARIGAPGSPFPLQKYKLSGAQQFPTDGPLLAQLNEGGYKNASRAVSEAIKKYRKAVDNFWEGEDSSFEAVAKVITSSVSLGAARVARRLQQNRGFGIPDAIEQSIDNAEKAVSSYKFPMEGIIGPSSPLGKITAKTTMLETGNGGGGRRKPPASSGVDPEEINRKIGDAATRGAEGLLGLEALKNPAKASSYELEALAAALESMRKVLNPTIKGFDVLDNKLRETSASIGRQLERRDPNADFLTRQVGSRGGRAISEGLIGGAFPLLFGQGIGASIGGGVGGAAGGFAGGGLGFGLSLLGTALGSAFDAAIQSANELGNALRKPAESFDELAQKSFFSSRGLEEQIKKTIEYGDTALASAMIQEEAIAKFGKNGVKNLAYLESESDKLNRAWAELGQQMQALLAGPVAAFLSVINKAIGSDVRAGRLMNVRSGLSPAEQKTFDEEVNKAAKYKAIYKPGKAIPDEFHKFARLSPEESQAMIDKWAPLVVKAEIKITQKEIDASKLNALQKKLEAIDLSKGIKDQVRSAAREQRDIDKQRADLVRSYEQSIAEIRKRIEEEIARRRFSVLEKENQLLDLQGQNRIRQLQLAGKEAIRTAGSGQRPEIEETAKKTAAIVAQFTEQQLTAAEEEAKIKRDAALEARKFDFEAASFKANIEKEVSRLNIETARQVAQINEQVRRRNEEYDSNRFITEKAIAELQLKKSIAEVNANIEGSKKQLAQFKAVKNPSSPQVTAIKAIENYLEIQQRTQDILEKGQSEISKISAPAKLRGVGAVGGGKAPTTGINREISQERLKISQITAEMLKAVDFSRVQATKEFVGAMEDLSKEIMAPMSAFNREAMDQQRKNVRYLELVRQGYKGVVAEQMIEVEGAGELAMLRYQAAIDQLEQKDTLDAMVQSQYRLVDAQVAQLNAQKAAGGLSANRIAQIDAEIAALQKYKDVAPDVVRAQLQSQVVRLQNEKGAIPAKVKEINRGAASAEEGQNMINISAEMNTQMNELISRTNMAKELALGFSGALSGGAVSIANSITGLDTLNERLGIQNQIKQLEALKSGVDANSEAYRKYEEEIAGAKSELAQLGDTGTRVQQAMANMMRGIADEFISMAQKIIAQQIAMITFGSIMKILGIAAPSSAKPDQLTTTLQGQAQYMNVDSGITPFAKGGAFTNSIVSSPTLMQFEDAGVMKTGVMGEAGDEAVMPLTRGPGGSLGVKAYLSDSRAALAGPSPSKDEEAFADNREALAATSAVSRERYVESVLTSGASSTEIKYSRVGSGDLPFVTEEDMLQATRLAAQEGAKLGERRTLAALRNNPAIRRLTGV